MGKGTEDSSNSLRQARKAHITHVLETTGYDIEKAAELLNIPVRVLRSWMRKLDISEPGNGPTPAQTG